MISVYAHSTFPMIARLLLESQSYEEIPYLPEISFLLGHYLLLIMFSSGIFFYKARAAGSHYH